MKFPFWKTYLSIAILSLVIVNMDKLGLAPLTYWPNWFGILFGQVFVWGLVILPIMLVYSLVTFVLSLVGKMLLDGNPDVWHM